MKKYSVICVLLLGLVSGALAFPFANYGNIRVPDGGIMPHTMAKISMMNYLLPENNRKDDDLAYNWGTALNIGLFEYGELGVVYTGDELFYLHLKARILKESLTYPSISIGIDNLLSDVPKKDGGAEYPDVVDAGNYSENSMYISLSKTTMIGGLPLIRQLPTRLTLGIGTNRFTGTSDLSETFNGIFAAVKLDYSPNVSFIVEVDGHNLNSGFEYLRNNIGGKIILYRIEEWDRRDPKIGISLSYTFDNFVGQNRRDDFYSQGQTPELKMTITTGPNLEDLQMIRRQRERADQELEEIKRILEK